MLQFRGFQSERFFGALARQSKRVKRAARVASLVLVEFAGSVKFQSTNQQDFDGEQRGQVGPFAPQVKAEVLRLLQLNLTGVLPGDARRGFADGDAGDAQHRPSGVQQFALAKSVDVERFVERNDRSFRRLVVALLHLTDDVTSRVLRRRAVQLVQVELQVFHRFGQAKRIEASVTRHGAIQPRRSLRVRVPELLLSLATSDRSRLLLHRRLSDRRRSFDRRRLFYCWSSQSNNRASQNTQIGATHQRTLFRV